MVALLHGVMEWLGHDAKPSGHPITHLSRTRQEAGGTGHFGRTDGSSVHGGVGGQRLPLH